MNEAHEMSMSKMMCSRELTLTEEIKELNIEEKDTERLIKKAAELEKVSMSQEEYLYSFHIETDQLKAAIIEQAKIIGILRKEIIDMKRM